MDACFWMSRSARILCGVIAACVTISWATPAMADDPENLSELRAMAERGDASAQYKLARAYEVGNGVPKSASDALRWYTKSAEQGDARAQFGLGVLYANGQGVPKNDAEALAWIAKAADQGNVEAQRRLGFMYAFGAGVPQNDSKAVKWYTKAAQQGDADAQCNLARMHWLGEGTPRNNVFAYSWASLAAAAGKEHAAKLRDDVAKEMTKEQVAEAQRMSASFRPGSAKPRSDLPEPSSSWQEADAFGSGFFVSNDGYFVTNQHVVADARRVRVRTDSGTYPAEIVRTDIANDLALLKVGGSFRALHVRGSAGLRAADRVSTVGYPNPALQGVAPKFSSGEVAALSGPGDDPTLIQISVSIQPGNSGGPLVDGSGRVVGVVVAQLNKWKALKVTGSLPENVNYAVRGTILLGLLESVPGLADKLQSPPKGDASDPATVAQNVAAATGMVLCDR